MHLVPQFDPANAATAATLVNGQTEFTIPLLGSGEPAKYAMISATIEARFKVGLAGVASQTNPHGVISLESGPIIISVAGQTTIDFDADAAGLAYVVPLANQ